MARKKLDTSSGGSAPWLNTFADLMNLLLCFFVMLFAFSDVNKEKFEKVSISMANSIGIYQGGGQSTGSGELISSGMSQISQLEQYYTQMGETGSSSGIDTDGQSDTAEPIDSKEGNQGTSDTDNSKENQSSGSSSTEEENKNMDISQAQEKINEAMADANAKMYDKLSDLTDKYNLGNSVDLNIDKNNKFVELSLNGSVLYDSGEANLKKNALPVLTSIGKVLKKFDGYNIEIIGHTDNVPMTSGTYKNNNWLSSARAINAAEYLIDECGIDPSTLKYSGRGPYEPISSNDTPEGRAKNRRIEIKIYNQYSNE